MKRSGYVPKTAFLNYVWEFSLCLKGMWKGVESGPLAPQGGPRGTTSETLGPCAQNRISKLCVGVFSLPREYVDVGRGIDVWEFSLCLVGMWMWGEGWEESWDKVSFSSSSQLSFEGGRKGHAQPRPQIFFDRATALDATAIQEPRQQWRRFPDGETKGTRLP